MSDPSIQRGPSKEVPCIGYDATTKHAYVPLEVVSVQQDATTGQWYGVLNVNATVSPAANQRVNAQAGDFPTNSIADLATLLARYTDTFGTSTPISAATTFGAIPLVSVLAANSFATLPNASYQDTFIAQINVASAFVGTIGFYGLLPDGSTLQQINAHQRASTTTGSSTAINTGAALEQTWEGSIAAFKAIYVVCTAFTSGAASVQIGLTAADYAHAIINTVAQNLTQVGGTALALGQTTKSASIPVTLPSDAAIPVNVGTPTGSVVSVGTGSTAVVTPGANAKFLTLINDSANTIYLNISGGAATLNAGIRLNANGGSILFDRYVPSAAITAISSIAASNLLVEVG